VRVESIESATSVKVERESETARVEERIGVSVRVEEGAASGGSVRVKGV
jgi:hypothetical protein